MISVLLLPQRWHAVQCDCFCLNRWQWEHHKHRTPSDWGTVARLGELGIATSPEKVKQGTVVHQSKVNQRSSRISSTEIILDDHRGRRACRRHASSPVRPVESQPQSPLLMSQSARISGVCCRNYTLTSSSWCVLRQTSMHAGFRAPNQPPYAVSFFGVKNIKRSSMAL